jgi:hypothetical protein
MYLNSRLFFRPEKVVRFYLHDGDASSRQGFGFCGIELVTDPHIDGARNHGYCAQLPGANERGSYSQQGSLAGT